jgi:hypothetical protein
MTDDEPDYESEFEDLDEKVVLVEILAELQQIRRALTDADSGRQRASSGDVMYRCTRCADGTEVPEGKRERHARNEHRAPPDMALSMFEPIE